MKQNNGKDKESVKHFQQRKQAHIKHAMETSNQAIGLSGLDEIDLIHEALPDINFDSINLETKFLNHTLPTPFFISSMTAGHAEGKKINQRLAKACAERQWLMGVGSQRRQLFDNKASQEWQELKQKFPEVKLMGNIGIAQAIQTDTKAIQQLADSIGAIAMIVHLNALQECLQPEGTPQFSNSFNTLKRLATELTIPLIVKETGCGMSQATLSRLNTLPIAAVDISGLGGTHWGRIEGKRGAKSDRMRFHAAETFKNWGISTVQSLLNAKSIAPHFAVMASGGIRNGLDAAKCLNLGAQLVGIGQPMLKSALQNANTVINSMQQFEFELKVALFCMGKRNLK